MRVFVVDDDDCFRASVLRLLAGSGHEAVGFDSAGAFLGTSHLGEEGLLILDIAMPIMGGLELQRRLRDMNSPLQVVVVTGTSLPEQRRTAFQQGAAGFLAKPFEGEALLALLGTIAQHGTA